MFYNKKQIVCIQELIYYEQLRKNNTTIKKEKESHPVLQLFQQQSKYHKWMNKTESRLKCRKQSRYI